MSDEAGERILLPGSSCLGSRPESEAPCSRENCPRWSAGAWSDCSVTCGTGVKHRTVSCRNNTGDLSSDCLGDKPAETESCSSKCTAVSVQGSSQLQAAGWQKVETDNNTLLIRDQYSDYVEPEVVAVSSLERVLRPAWLWPLAPAPVPWLWEGARVA